MCGIGGIYSVEKLTSVANKTEAIKRTLQHRGPDGNGSFANENVLLVHTRLSIIDVSLAGAQPFYNEDQSIVAVANGEIYNYKSLKSDLEKKGHHFLGLSDCEIIPHLYEEYGDNLFSMLEGMFALAIYDTANNKLILGRDRFGIKPLYYTFQHNSLYFGSELKAILCHSEIDVTPDWQAIHDFLSLCYIPEPATGFENINILLPGHYLVQQDVSSICQRYDNDFFQPSLEEVDNYPQSDKIELLLSKAIKEYKVADVPLGAFLSGGIDSSIVVKTLQEQSGETDLQTFTAKFKIKSFDESKQASVIAQILGTKHHTLLIDELECTPALMEELLTHFDQPFADSSAIPTYLMSRKIREHVKVALSGDGGDEVFGGYSQFWYMDYIDHISKLPSIIKYFARKIFNILKPVFPEKSRQLLKIFELSEVSINERLFRLNSYQSEKEKLELYNHNFLNKFRQLQPTSRIFSLQQNKHGKQYFSISHVLFRNSLPGDMFKKVDMMSMKAGIEVRVPFMQEALVKNGINLKDKEKIKGRKGKQVLRDILKKKLPAKIVDAPKSGFAIPLDRMLTNEMCDWIREILCTENTRIYTVLKEMEVKVWVEEFLTNKRNKNAWSREGLYQRIFMLLSLELWMRNHNIKIS
jgi:asparagine synthase (glutamine-hydrolysing)